jgi:hypothetical protein
MHYYRYQPYPYYRRYYNIDPYYYGRYYSPYNIFNSQIASINQRLVNFGGMTNVTQDANIYQLRTPAPEPESVDVLPEPEDVEPVVEAVAEPPSLPAASR